MSTTIPMSPDVKKRRTTVFIIVAVAIAGFVLYQDQEDKKTQAIVKSQSDQYEQLVEQEVSLANVLIKVYDPSKPKTTEKAINKLTNIDKEVNDLASTFIPETLKSPQYTTESQRRIASISDYNSTIKERNDDAASKEALNRDANRLGDITHDALQDLHRGIVNANKKLHDDMQNIRDGIDQ